MGFEVFDVFGEFLDLLFELLDEFFVFFVLFLDHISFSFHLDEGALEIDDVLGFLKLRLDGPLLLLHEIIDEILEVFVLGLFFFKQSQMLEFHLFFAVEHEFQLRDFFDELLFGPFQVINL